MNYLSTGAGFLPSTVIMLVLGSVYHIMWFFKLTWGFLLWHKVHRSWHLQQPPHQSGRIPRSPQNWPLLRDAWSAVQDILHGPCVRETRKHCKASQFLHHFWPTCFCRNKLPWEVINCYLILSTHQTTAVFPTNPTTATFSSQASKLRLTLQEMKTLGVLSFRQKNPGKKKTTNQVTSDDPQAQDIAK